MQLLQPEIIFEDDDLIVVNKPSGWLSIPDRFDVLKPNLIAFLQKKNCNVLVVHRLDRETSGLIIFAKNETAHRGLNQQMMDKTAEKYYLALTEGIVSPSKGEINKPLAESMTRAGTMIVAKRGKDSLTTYETIETFKNFTLLEVRIHTGRMHQVRVHLQSIGHPLAIDSIYGRRESISISDIKIKKLHLNKYQTETKPMMERTTLHSKKLIIQHPTSLEKMTFEAPIHKDFSALLTQLRKWG